MDRIIRFGRAHLTVLVAAAAYLLISLLLVGWYRHAINPDGISYITIAEKYAHGNFSEAINGYWGPLFSWLLAPLIFLQRDPQVAAKFVLTISGVISIGLSYLLLRRWQIKHSLTILFYIAFVPLLLYWIMPGPITPDALVLSAFLGYLYFLSGGLDIKNTIGLGFIIALGFYAKAVFLPFALIHVTLFYGYKLWRTKKPAEKSDIKKVWLLSVGVAVVLILPWVILLSHKYHKLTYSTTGSYNFALLNPSHPGQPMDYLGLLPPPNTTALSVWEDPSYIPQASWSPLSSRSNLGAYVTILTNNMERFGAALLQLSSVAVAFVIGLIGYILYKAKKANRSILLIFSALIIYSLGYILVVLEYRYFLPVFAGMLLCAVLLLNQVPARKLRLSSLRAFIVIILATLIVTPLSQLYYQRNEYVPAYYQAEQMAPYIKPGEHLAADKFGAVGHCFYLQARCYGAFSPSASDQANEAQINKYHITAVLILDTPSGWQKPPYLSDFTEVTQVGTAVLLKR